MYAGFPHTYTTYRGHYVEMVCPLTLNKSIDFPLRRDLQGNKPIQLQKKPYRPDTITYQLSSSPQNINGKPKTTDIWEKIQNCKKNKANQITPNEDNSGDRMAHLKIFS